MRAPRWCTQKVHMQKFFVYLTDAIGLTSPSFNPMAGKKHKSGKSKEATEPLFSEKQVN
ncbi:MAG: hypothetical protein V1493_00155 [Candidatus Diapherotrites archaeon]